MFNVVEKIGNCFLTIHSTKDKKSAERIAKHLQKVHKDRIIIVKEVKKP